MGRGSHSSHTAPEFPRESLESSVGETSSRAKITERARSGQSQWDHAVSEGIISGYPPIPGDSQETSTTPTGPQATFSPQTETSRHSGTAYPSAIKFLVSNNVAGSIIGRSGQTISELQADSSTRIKLSQSGDYYPGTQERVCLVQGLPENVKKAAGLLLTRLHALQQQQQQQAQQSWAQNQQREEGAVLDPSLMLGASSAAGQSASTFSYVVRILVPAASCGMIIGKSGANIKQLVEASGVTSVRLAPKEGEHQSSSVPAGNAAVIAATSERAVTITGPDLDSCVNCIFIILDAMTAHQDICRYANMTTSYTRMTHVGHDSYAANPSTRSPGTVPTTGRQTSEPMGTPPSRSMEMSSRLWDPAGGQSQRLGNPMMDLQPGGGSLDMSLSFGGLVSAPANLPPGYGHTTPTPLDQRRESIQYSPVFGAPAPVPFMPTSPGIVPFSQSPLRPPMQQSMYLPFDQQGSPGNAMDPGPHGGQVTSSSSAPDLFSMQFQESMQLSDSQPAFQQQVGAPYPQPAHAQQHSFTAQVAIPDSLIGSILGRGGRTLNELQLQSSTRIRISQKGEYVPGTKNRIVTIRGPTAQSVTTAQFLMSQRMVLAPTALTSTTAFPIQPVDRDLQRRDYTYRRSMSESHAAPPPHSQMPDSYQRPLSESHPAPQQHSHTPAVEESSRRPPPSHHPPS